MILICSFSHGSAKSVGVVALAVGPFVFGQELQQPFSGVEP
jgi:hypothetical protein